MTMLIKLRAGIIHKLGGYTKSDFSQHHPVIITADYRIRKCDYDKLVDADGLARREVYVRLLAELLRNMENLAVFRREENYRLDTYDYKAWIKVLRN